MKLTKTPTKVSEVFLRTRIYVEKTSVASAEKSKNFDGFPSAIYITEVYRHAKSVGNNVRGTFAKKDYGVIFRFT